MYTCARYLNSKVVAKPLTVFVNNILCNWWFLPLYLSTIELFKQYCYLINWEIFVFENVHVLAKCS